MTECELLKLLEKHKLRVTTAESCTGGLVAALLCDIPGISAYFEEGFITYSEAVKQKTLGVPQDVLQSYGVVSTQTAEAMAEGACRITGASLSIATTGVAGPGGGAKETPVGCVCIAWVVAGKTYSKRCQFSGNRMEVRMQAATYALEQLCQYITEEFPE